MHRIGFGAHIGGAFARVLDGQGGGEHHHFLGAVAAAAFDDYAGQARVHGECRHGSADGGEGCAIAAALAGLAGAFGERAEFAQQVHAVVDGARCGRLHEREAGDVAGLADHADCDHLQDDGCEVGAQNFGVGELGARVEVFLGVEADCDAVADAAASTGALVGACLRDAFDGQALNLGACRVAGDACGAGVDDVLDAGHGQRGFGNVRGEHDARARSGGEHAVLFGEREARVQGQHFVVQARRLENHCLDGVLGVADFAFAGEEDEDVAGRFLGEFLDGVEDAVGGVVVVFDFVVAEVVFLVERAVADFHGVGSAGHLNDGRRVVGQDCFGDFAFFGAEVFVDDALARHVAGGEVARETLRVDGRGGDDDLQVRALRQDALEVAEDEVNVQAAFVRFVNDEGGVAAQQLVVLDFGEQNAVGHELDGAVFAHFGGESHLVADGFADFLAEFFGDAFGDGACGEAARLGVADETLLSQAQVEAHFGDLGGLTGAGFTRDDDDLVVADRVHDVFAAFADG